MKFTGANIKDGKTRGEWAEMRFMARASEQGLRVSKPWGDSSSYDFIIEPLHQSGPGKLLRVQVKSTTYSNFRSYIVHLHGARHRRYTSDNIDFVAAYIIPKDIWFIFPIAAIVKVHSSMVLSPHMKVSKYGQYQEAWNLLRGEGDLE
jgi:hypothetical protein